MGGFGFSNHHCQSVTNSEWTRERSSNKWLYRSVLLALTYTNNCAFWLTRCLSKYCNCIAVCFCFLSRNYKKRIILENNDFVVYICSYINARDSPIPRTLITKHYQRKLKPSKSELSLLPPPVLIWYHDLILHQRIWLSDSRSEAFTVIAFTDPLFFIQQQRLGESMIGYGPFYTTLRCKPCNI